MLSEKISSWEVIAAELFAKFLFALLQIFHEKIWWRSKREETSRKTKNSKNSGRLNLWQKFYRPTVIFKKQCTWFNWEEMRVEMVSSGSKMVQLQPIIFLFSDFSHDYLALAWIFNVSSKTQRRQCIRKHGDRFKDIMEHFSPHPF